jgi:REP element-mobilizing transposase RayT
MNRGYDGNDIFFGNQNKSQFLDYLEGACNQMMIRLFAYCVMDNHYHLVLENSSGRMSDFLKLLNGQYGCITARCMVVKAMCFKVDLNPPLLKMMAI